MSELSELHVIIKSSLILWLKMHMASAAERGLLLSSRWLEAHEEGLVRMKQLIKGRIEELERYRERSTDLFLHGKQESMGSFKKVKNERLQYSGNRGSRKERVETDRLLLALCCELITSQLLPFNFLQQILIGKQPPQSRFLKRWFLVMLNV